MNSTCAHCICAMSYMRPSYTPLPLDAPHPFKLYRYRERGQPQTSARCSLAVLFVPGHGGSHEQVRSIARATLDAARGAAVDFYALASGERFSAFDGDLLLAQAAAIRTAATVAQQDAGGAPIAILAHSMGAVAALEAERAPAAGRVPLQPAAIVTLAAPLRRPPLACSASLDRVYAGLREAARQPAMPTAAAVASFWAPGDWQTSERAADPNSTVAAGALALAAPMDALPDVWVGADHQSILWCKQLATTLARAFASLAVALDQAHPAPLPVSERAALLRRALLLDPDDGDDADDNCARCVPYAHCAEKCVDNAWPCPDWERCVARGSEAVEAERRRSLRGSLTLTLLASPLEPLADAARVLLLLAAARPGADASRRDVRLRYAAAACIFLAALAYGGGARVTLGLTAAAAISAGARAGGALCAAPRRWLGGLGGRNVAVARVALALASVSLAHGSIWVAVAAVGEVVAGSEAAALAVAAALALAPGLAAWTQSCDVRLGECAAAKKWSDDARHLAFLLLLTLPLAAAPRTPLIERLRRKLRPPFLVALAAALTADDGGTPTWRVFLCAWLGHYFAQ